jgi:type IV fimbrial biogenesis protein FimT
MEKSYLKQQAGFTLFELLVVLAIAGVFASVAVPGVQSSIAQNQRSSCISEMVSMLSVAREEAVSRQQQVALCGSTDGASCNTNSWQTGWLLFVDDGTGAGGVAGDLDLNGDEQLLRVAAGSCGNLSVHSANFVDAGGIGFEPEGLAADRGSLVICSEDKDETAAAAVVLNISGQPRLATDSNDNGTVEQDNGDEVSCA